MVARSIEISAIFEFDAGWSVYYVHCTFCIRLKLALTTLQFKRSDVKIEYNEHKTDSLCEEQVCESYNFFKTIIGMYLNRHELLALHKR